MLELTDLQNLKFFRNAYCNFSEDVSHNIKIAGNETGLEQRCSRLQHLEAANDKSFVRFQRNNAPSINPSSLSGESRRQRGYVKDSQKPKTSIKDNLYTPIEWGFWLAQNVLLENYSGNLAKGAIPTRPAGNPEESSILRQYVSREDANFRHRKNVFKDKHLFRK